MLAHPIIPDRGTRLFHVLIHRPLSFFYNIVAIASNGRRSFERWPLAISKYQQQSEGSSISRSLSFLVSMRLNVKMMLNLGNLAKN